LTALIATVFLASLLGSAHCVGMCGPLALIAATNRDQHGRRPLAPVFAYNGGRFIVYVIIGFLFGWLGQAINLGTSLTGFQRGATTFAGCSMIVIGCIAVMRSAGMKIPLPDFARPLHRLLNVSFKKSATLTPVHRALLMGMLTSLMPCGWLYAFAITAAGTGHPLSGAATMAVFWTGTVPLLTAFTIGFTKMTHSIQRKIPVLMNGLIIIVGLLTLFSRAPVRIGETTHVASSLQQATEQIEVLDQETLPCCQSSE
jgi:sulfite exporter TauE/SafE